MNYLGITVGPIIETMMRTSSPAGLWLSSYFFSIIIRDLCIELQDKCYDVFSLPEGYVVKDHKTDHPGTGRYHDRIYACKEADPGTIEEDIRSSVETVLHERAEELEKCGIDKRDSEDIFLELRSFVQIHYIVAGEEDVEASGVSGALLDMLDCLELSQDTEQKQGESYFHRVMAGSNEEGSNVHLKGYPPLTDALSDPYFLLADRKNGRIAVHNLEYLSTLGCMGVDDPDTPKIKRYFAVVQCDGDNMGTLFSSLTSTRQMMERQRSVTQQNFSFADLAVSRIADFGGFAIYAGGDDLLFLSPVIGKDGKTVFELCRELAEQYSECLNRWKLLAVEQKSIPLEDDHADGSGTKAQETDISLSMGVSINYYKYPLYEALSDARGLLFGTAKEYTEGRDDSRHKNNIAVKLRKASGSKAGFVCCMNSAGCVYGNDTYNAFIKMLNRYYLKDEEQDVDENKDDEKKKTGEKDRMMHSVLYHIESIKSLFLAALDRSLSLSGDDRFRPAERLFDNFFDNVGQSFGKGFIGELSRFAVNVTEDHRDMLVKGITDSPEDDNALFAVTSMLRVAKFLLEERV